MNTFNHIDLTRLQKELELGYANGLFTSADLWFEHLGTPPQHIYVGNHRWYDLASLTKPLVTTTIAAYAYEQLQFDLQQPILHWLPEFIPSPRDTITPQHLLRHTSGLPAFNPWYSAFNPDDSSNAQQQKLLQTILQEPLVHLPVGSTTLYSDTGFIVLATLLCKFLKLPDLTTAWQNIVMPKLPANTQLTFEKLDKHQRHKVAPTGYCPWRKRQLQGEVHDANAAALGPLAGHAGLFGTARGVADIARQWLHPSSNFLLSPSTVTNFITRPNQGRPLGWDIPGPGPSQAGNFLPADLYGHLGFTGTSLWLSQSKQFFVILLTNRVIAPQHLQAFRHWRPALHDLIWQKQI